MAIVAQNPNGHHLMVQSNPFTDETTYFVQHMDADQIWRCAVAKAASMARATLPESLARIDKAVAIVTAKGVQRDGATSGRVTSQADPQQQYTVTQGACTCVDFEHAPRHLCKHVLAVMLTTKALGLTRRMTAADTTLTIGLEDLTVDEPLTVADAQVTTAVRQLSADWLQQPDAPEPAPLEAFSNGSPGHAPSTKPLEPPKPRRTRKPVEASSAPRETPAPERHPGAGYTLAEALAQLDDPIKPYLMPIKGKPYLTVAGRVLMAQDEHRKASATLTISTEFVEMGSKWVCKAVVTSALLGSATGHAVVPQSGSGAEATAPVEVAETSAVGRALGFLGYGVFGAGVASAEEMLQGLE